MTEILIAIGGYAGLMWLRDKQLTDAMNACGGPMAVTLTPVAGGAGFQQGQCAGYYQLAQQWDWLPRPFKGGF